MGGNNPMVISDQFGDTDATVYTIIQSAHPVQVNVVHVLVSMYVPVGEEGAINCSVTKLVGDLEDSCWSAIRWASLCGTTLESMTAAKFILDAQTNLQSLGGVNLVEAKAGEAAFVSPVYRCNQHCWKLPDEEYFRPTTVVRTW